MKKLTALALVFATSFAMANNGQEENVNPTTTQTEQTQQVSYEEIFKRAEEDALYCKVELPDNGGSASCILCNCERFAEKLLK